MTTMAVAAAEPPGTRLEALFRPSTRFRDSHRSRRGRLPIFITEVELLQDLALEDVLATGITWDVGGLLSFPSGQGRLD
jgi:hypothetical protein